MNSGIVTAAYIIAAILFILSLSGLSNQETARRGNMFGIAGMAIAARAGCDPAQLCRTRSCIGGICELS